MEPIEHIRRNFLDSISTRQQALETAAQGIALRGRDGGGIPVTLQEVGRKFAHRDLPRRASRKYIYRPFTAPVI